MPPALNNSTVNQSENLKILFLTVEKLSASSGISKKILAQKKGFETNGHKCYLGTYVQNGSRMHYKIDNDVLHHASRHITCDLFTPGIYRKLYQWIIDNNPALVYIRYTHFANPFSTNLFRKLHHKGIKIVIEIPTYPYDAEYVSIKGGWLKLLIEKHYRKQLAGYCHRIATLTDDQEIWGRKTVRFTNGIDLHETPLRSPAPHGDGLNLIGVAGLSYWHGYDRVIKGLKLYYDTSPEREVTFHIVSCGNKALGQELMRLTDKLGLQKRVNFHIDLTGPRLDHLFDISDIGIGCLGCHRKNLHAAKPLKSVEYAARGIPFCYSESNDDFDSEKFILKIPADESPVDISQLVRFSDSCNIAPSDIRQSTIHHSWTVQTARILASAGLTD